MKKIKHVISLDLTTHSYHFSGMDKNAIVITASELAKGKPHSGHVSTAMIAGTNAHMQLFSSLEKFYNGESEGNPSDLVEEDLKLIIGDSKPRFELCAGLEFNTEFGKVYLFGTCDVLTDDAIIEYKTGKVYNHNENQLRTYMTMFDKKIGHLYYGDLRKKCSYDAPFEGAELLTMITKFIRKNYHAPVASEIRSQKLVNMWKQKLELEAQAKLIAEKVYKELESEDFLKAKWGGFTLEYSKSKVSRTSYNKDLIQEKLPEAVVKVESERRNVRLLQELQVAEAPARACAQSSVN